MYSLHSRERLLAQLSAVASTAAGSGRCCPSNTTSGRSRLCYDDEAVAAHGESEEESMIAHRADRLITLHTANSSRLFRCASDVFVLRKRVSPFRRFGPWPCVDTGRHIRS